MDLQATAGGAAAPVPMSLVSLPQGSALNAGLSLATFGKAGTVTAGPAAGLPTPAVTVPTSVVGVPQGGGTTAGLGYAGTHTANLGALNIVISAGTGLSSNPAALAAFDRGAARWASRITTPTTVTINADLINMNSATIIGDTEPVMLQGGFDEIRDAAVANATHPDDAIVRSLPTSSQFSTYVPTGFSLDPSVLATKANCKALGFADLDTLFGARDATMTFNSGFAFTYDNSHGVAPGTMDFETVAAHEIGHVLGFMSSVDDADYYLSQGTTGTVAPTLLDLFRFQKTSAPTTAADFPTAPRDMVPGMADVTDQVIAPWGTLTDSTIDMSTGFYTGDGNQASHWKDGESLGIMGPTLAYGVYKPNTEADYRSMDLLGWDVAPVPEPGTIVLLLACAAVYFVRRRPRRQ
jgi:hypothetical protein